jgi:hypothetical protein
VNGDQDGCLDVGWPALRQRDGWRSWWGHGESSDGPRTIRALQLDSP